MKDAHPINVKPTVQRSRRLAMPLMAALLLVEALCQRRHAREGRF